MYVSSVQNIDRLGCFGKLVRPDMTGRFWPEGDIRRAWAIISATDPLVLPRFGGHLS